MATEKKLDDIILIAGLVILVLLAIFIGFGVIFPPGESETPLDVQIDSLGIKIEALNSNQKILATNDSTFAYVLNRLSQRVKALEEEK